MLPSTTTLRRRASFALSALLSVHGVSVSSAHAEIYLIKPGDDWSILGPKLVPGDELSLLEGVHVAAQFTGVAGSAEKPIVIRSSANGKLAEIAPGREGLKLTDCSHVRIERVLIKNARRAGVVIDATASGKSHDLALHDVLVVGVAGLVEQSGILVRETARLEVKRSRFENCIGAAMRFEHTSEVSVERVQILAAPTARAEHGILILGPNALMTFHDVWISGAIGTGLSLGASDAPHHVSGGPTIPAFPPPIRAPSARPEETLTPRPTEPVTPAQPVPEQVPAPDASAKPLALVRGATFEHLLLHGTDRPFEFGSCEEITISNCTVVDPHEEVFRIGKVATSSDGSAASLSVRFRNNIVVWKAGGLRRFTDLAEGVSAAGLNLGPNYWWSNELPSALPLLGPVGAPFPGTLEVPQTIDIDPDLDDHHRPRLEAVRMSGRSVT